MSRWLGVGVVTALFLSAVSLYAEEELKVLGSPTIVVGTTNTGSVQLQLRNDSNDPIPVSLDVGPFVSATTGQELNVMITLQAPDEQAASAVWERREENALWALPPGELLTLSVNANNLWEAGESVAKLRNRGISIGEIRAVKYQVPFQVTLNTADPKSPGIIFDKGEEGLFLLQNGDGMSYTIRWELILQDTAKSAEGMVTLPPNSTVTIKSSPPEEWFGSIWNTIGRWIRDDVEDGYLTLRFQPPGRIGDPSVRTKTIPLKVQLRSAPAWLQALLQFLFVFFLLGAGGGCSLALNYWVPNKLGRARIKERLRKLHTRIREISTDVDSRQRVDVRVARLRIFKEVDGSRTFSPELPSVLERAEAELKTLETRVELTRKIDRSRVTLSKLHQSAPPTTLRLANEQLADAEDLLRDSGAEEDELRQAQTLIDAADKRLAGVGQDDPELARSISERIKELLKDFKDPDGELMDRDTTKDLRGRLLDLFAALDPKYEDAAKIHKGQYYWLDHATERLVVLRHFILRHDDTKDAQDDEGKQWHKKIKNRENRLVNLLRQKTWASLNEARLLKQKIDAGIFSDDVRAEIEAGGAAIEILADPQYPMQNEHVTLQTVFRNPYFQNCEAHRDFECVWNFADVGTEKGWKISHYFADAGSNDLNVSFLDPGGKNVNMDDVVCVKRQINVRRPTDQWGDRTRVELFRFALVMFVALLGLVVGAREQLSQLDFVAGVIAVFSIGFGADTIKNLLTSQPREQQPNPG